MATDRQPRRILYAPTWEGFYDDSCYCSLRVMGEAIAETLTAVPGRYVIDFKSHPLTGTSKVDYRDAQNSFIARIRGTPMAGTLNTPGRALYEYFADCDLLIADVSSVVSDFIYLNRPIVLTAPRGNRDMTRRFPISQACYVVTSEPFALSALLEDALGDDPKREARGRIRDHVLSPPNGASPMEAFRAALESLARTAASRQAPLSREEQQRLMGHELSTLLPRLSSPKAHSFSE